MFDLYPAKMEDAILSEVAAVERHFARRLTRALGARSFAPTMPRYGLADDGSMSARCISSRWR